MSAAAQLAELEAAIAEHELSDQLTDEQRELVKHAVHDGAELDAAIDAVLERPVAPQAEQPQPSATEPTEQQLKGLDKENSRHRDKVFELMGPFMAGFEPCEKCGTLGFTPPGPQPRTHENFKTCATCVGFGKVLTGSRAPGHELADCPECGGWGYLVRTEAPAPAIAAVNSPGAPPAEPQYGRPTWMGDPSIGTPGA